MHLATAQAWGSKPVLHLPVVNRFHPPVRAVRSTTLEGLTTTDRRTVMIEFDKGPLQPFARIFAACPDYGEFTRHFWYDWGPIFHRGRSEEHPSELQSLMRISYTVFCFKKKQN